MEDDDGDVQATLLIMFRLSCIDCIDCIDYNDFLEVQVPHIHTLYNHLSDLDYLLFSLIIEEKRI